MSKTLIKINCVFVGSEICIGHLTTQTLLLNVYMCKTPWWWIFIVSKSTIRSFFQLALFISRSLLIQRFMPVFPFLEAKGTTVYWAFTKGPMSTNYVKVAPARFIHSCSEVFVSYLLCRWQSVVHKQVDVVGVGRNKKQQRHTSAIYF